jgi:multidrug efflux pump subunit AcrA (membrane-fusion protein)
MTMEMQVKKREWVKNAAIIFLAVMLVLTFFSNTFMNRSLPEVATQYVQSGEITAQIRGSGTVTANGTYDIILPQSREVESVKVREGDTVKEGDVLFTLIAAKSDDLRQAQDSLRTLVLNYSKALIDASTADYAKSNLDIKRAKEDLQAAQSKLTKLPYADDTSIYAAQIKVDKAQAAADKAKKVLASLGGQTSSGSSSSEPAADLSAAMSKFSADQLIYGKDYRDLLSAVITDRMQQAAKDKGKASVTISADSDLVAAYVNYEYDVFTGASADRTAINKAAAAGTELAEVNQEFASKWENRIGTYMQAAAEGGFSGVSALIKADENQQTAYKTLSADAKAVADAKSAVNSAYQDKYLSDQQKSAQIAYDTASAELDAAKASLDTLKSEQTAYEAQADAVKAQQRTLEDKLLDLESTKKTDSKALEKQRLDLADMRAQIGSQQAAVGEIAKNSSETDVKAKVSGVMKTVTAVAGKTYDSNTALGTIMLPDHGYSVSFSVTNDQARKVHKGDTGTISNYYDGQLTATLQTIKPDPQNPQTNRVLVFDIGGEVAEGTNLSISVGEHSAQYDTIVPNNAIRSDSNGDFVLTVVSKSSPLGNRYIATRVDVEKVASDDTNTAVSGALSMNDYVITTSSKPVNNKDHVKLADS